MYRDIGHDSLLILGCSFVLLVLIGPFIAEPFSAETYSEHDIRSPLYERTEKWSGKDRELFTGQTTALIHPAGKIFPQCGQVFTGGCFS
jgi:hypothetical protein